MDHAWLQSERGSYSPEIVIPFTRDPAYITQKASFAPCAYQPIQFDERWKLPASEWLYFKFYLESEGENQFLLQHLAPVAEYLRQQEKIELWFFVRYKDPQSHLRFRIKLYSLESLSDVMFLFQDMAKKWMERHLIHHLTLASYEREVERYGGPNLIDTAEALFCADAMASTFLLHAFINHQLNCQEIVFQALSII